ncbi:MAG: hypothetical protein PVH41_12870 [Anaerolineae bacterium]
MIEQRRGYVAYLLRLWQAKGEDGMAWRASLESVNSGEHLGFADLKELFVFLERVSSRQALDRTRPCDSAMRGVLGEQ